MNGILDFTKWLEENIRCFDAETTRLHQDDKHDEAAFAAIIKNVYDICKTVLNVFQKQTAAPEVLHDRYTQKLQELTNQWSSAMQRTQEFQDWKNSHVEQLKLEHITRIQTQFQKYTEAQS